MSSISDVNDDAMWETFNRFHYLCDTHRYQKLLARAELLRQAAVLPGDVLDAGTFKGVSTLQLAQFLQIYQPNGAARVVSFDTFDAVFPRVRDDEKQSAVDHGALFEENAFEQINEAVVRLGLSRRVEIVKGDITETLPAYIAKHPGFRISMLHCDLDVYPATKALLEMAWSRVVRGGIVVFDQYAVRNWGEADAADEFFSTIDQPPVLRVVPGTPTPTAYCVKA